MLNLTHAGGRKSSRSLLQLIKVKLLNSSADDKLLPHIMGLKASSLVGRGSLDINKMPFEDFLAVNTLLLRLKAHRSDVF